MSQVRPRTAIIGTGASAIGAAYTLRDDAEIVMFEATDRTGGHANSITVEPGIGADTGFVVFNRSSYPEMIQMFDELGVETVPHAGQFTFFNRETGLIYGSAELEGDAPPSDPHLAQIVAESERFAELGRKDFLRGQVNMPLREYLEMRGFSEDFGANYVTLLASAVWSAPRDLVFEMPAATIIAYFQAHGGSGLGGRGVAWETVRGGSRSYVDAAIAAVVADGGTVRLNTPVITVEGDEQGVSITTASGDVERFDNVVICTHADTSSQILRNPTAGQQEIFDTVRYNPTRLILHTDVSVLPEDRQRWMSWNYGSQLDQHGTPQPYVAWYVNLLQGYESTTDYVVSMDFPGEIPEQHVIADLSYTHPILDMGLRDLQSRIYDIAYSDRVTLAGSYFHSVKLGPDCVGNHEAAFSSGIKAAQHIRGQHNPRKRH